MRDFDHKPWSGNGSRNLLKCACVDNEMIEHTLVRVWFGQYGCNQKRTTAVLLPRITAVQILTFPHKSLVYCTYLG